MRENKKNPISFNAPSIIFSGAIDSYNYGDHGLNKPRAAFKAWLQTDEGYVFGPGIYSILRRVRETGTLKGAAESLGMSYRYAWGLVRKAEETLGQPLITTHKGGKFGGGGVALTELGFGFLDEFSQIESVMAKLLGEEIRALGIGPKNQVFGNVDEITYGDYDVDVVFKPSHEARLVLRIPKKAIAPIGLSEGSKVVVELMTLVSGVKLGEA